MNCRASWLKQAKVKELLSRHTTFKIGGPAEFWFEPKNPAELSRLIKIAGNKNIPFFVIGAGSNILAPDSGLKGIVIRLNKDYFKKTEFRKGKIFCGAGVMLGRLLSCARNFGLGGAEFLSGIPGTVGGALTMNAGVNESVEVSGCQSVREKTKQKTKSIGDLVESVLVMDYDGGISRLRKSGLEFSYRSSNLSNYIILSAVLKLTKKSKEEISADIAQYLARRRQTQDITLPSAGCIFKNPPNQSSGRLIDLCGLKGVSLGGAVISTKHANFILNKGKADARDVLGLIDLVRKKVKKKFGIKLETEIKIWP